MGPGNVAGRVDDYHDEKASGDGDDGEGGALSCVRVHNGYGCREKDE